MRLISREKLKEKLDRGDACPASPYAYELLTKKGYSNVRRYAGGIADWEEAGLPRDGEMVE